MIIMIFMMISKLWLFMVYGLWWAKWAKNNNEDQMSSLLKKNL